MKTGDPFGTALTVDQIRRRHGLEQNILFNIVIRKVRRKSTCGWVNIHRCTRGFQSFSTIHSEKQEQGYFISSVKVLLIHFLLAITTSTNQPAKYTINVRAVTDHAFWSSDLLNRINLSSPASLQLSNL